MRAYSQNQQSARDRDRLIAEHLDAAKRIVLRVARRVPDWLSVDDLLGAGMVGLTEAAERYDGNRGEPFIAFAEKRIRGAVLDELRRGDIMPRRVRHKARKVANTIRALEQKFGRSPTDEEAAAALDVTPNEYRETLAHLTQVAVVDLKGPELMPRANQANDSWSPAKQVEKRELVERVVEGIGRLSERDQLVLSLYYEQGLTYKEIGEVMEVTESRVCQLHGRAVSRLRVELQEPDNG